MGMPYLKLMHLYRSFRMPTSREGPGTGANGEQDSEAVSNTESHVEDEEEDVSAGGGGWGLVGWGRGVAGVGGWQRR